MPSPGGSSQPRGGTQEWPGLLVKRLSLIRSGAGSASLETRSGGRVFGPGTVAVLLPLNHRADVLDLPQPETSPVQPADEARRSRSVCRQSMSCFTGSSRWALVPRFPHRAWCEACVEGVQSVYSSSCSNLCPRQGAWTVHRSHCPGADFITLNLRVTPSARVKGLVSGSPWTVL